LTSSGWLNAAMSGDAVQAVSAGMVSSKPSREPFSMTTLSNFAPVIAK
jgi:hypothetical protein